MLICSRAELMFNCCGVDISLSVVLLNLSRIPASTNQ